MYKIYKYIILISSFLFCFASGLHSQTQEKKVEKAIEEQNVFQGIKIEYDVASLVMSGMSGGETYSTEGNLQVNIMQKYYPIVEIGFAGANKVSHNDFQFKTNGFFGRIGLDYNLLKPKDEVTAFHKMFTVGGRLGISPFSYDIKNVTVTDEYWGDVQTREYPNVNTTKVWVEVVAGMRVEVLKNFYLGWNVRNKILLGKEQEGAPSPWYIPGYGKKIGGNWSFNYTIGYAFNTQSKKK